MDNEYTKNEALLTVIKSLILNGLCDEAISLVELSLESAYKDGYHEAIEDLVDEFIACESERKESEESGS